MPELPEVETVRRTLLSKIKGRTIKDVDILYSGLIKNVSSDEFREKLINQKIENIDRFGKFLIFRLSDYNLLSHLRMEGKYFYKDKTYQYRKHDHIGFILDNDKILVYNDVRKFGTYHLFNKDFDIFNNKPLSNLGREINECTLEYLKEKFNKNKKIKTLLLDQSIIAGIGNIYADEILYKAKINPHRLGKDLNEEEIISIKNSTKEILDKAITLGGTTIRSYQSAEGIDGRFQRELKVHKREGKNCYLCNEIIKRDKISGRSTYYCPKCQK